MCSGAADAGRGTLRIFGEMTKQLAEWRVEVEAALKGGEGNIQHTCTAPGIRDYKSTPTLMCDVPCCVFLGSVLSLYIVI